VNRGHRRQTLLAALMSGGVLVAPMEVEGALGGSRPLNIQL
jgi:hypothetical protein